MGREIKTKSMILSSSHTFAFVTCVFHKRRSWGTVCAVLGAILVLHRILDGTDFLLVSTT